MVMIAQGEPMTGALIIIRFEVTKIAKQRILCGNIPYSSLTHSFLITQQIQR
jgi:hypothetical protein